MALNNLSSFHFNRILQNATAFPAHVYQTTRNSLGVNKRAEREVKHLQPDSRQKAQDTTIPIHRIPTAKATESYQPSPFPEQRESLIIEGTAVLKEAEPKITPPTTSDPVIPTLKPSRFPTINVNQMLGERILAEEARILEQLATPRLPQLTSSLPKANTPQASITTHNQQQLPVPVTLNPNFQAAIQTRKTMNWQLGHGVIEKVDKLTGEIVHLAEDCSKPLLVA